MYATFENEQGKAYSIDVWFDVYELEEDNKFGRQIGTFEEITDAIEFQDNEERETLIVMKHN